jgi:hypothetical protein
VRPVHLSKRTCFGARPAGIDISSPALTNLGTVPRSRRLGRQRCLPTISNLPCLSPVPRATLTAVGWHLFLLSFLGIFDANANDQDIGAEKNPKGVVADHRDFDEDANDRKHRDQERGDESQVHLLTGF